MSNKIEIENLIEHLAAAFGGRSQVPDCVVGMAVAGQINNQWRDFDDNDLGDLIRILYLDLEPGAEIEARASILRGMKDFTIGWPEDNPAVVATRALENQ